MKIKKIIWLILGFLGLGLGAVGAVVPMLPAFPFLMLALFSFGKSSEKLHKWFIGTKLYKNNLESFVMGQGMTCLLYTSFSHISLGQYSCPVPTKNPAASLSFFACSAALASAHIMLL